MVTLCKVLNCFDVKYDGGTCVVGGASLALSLKSSMPSPNCRSHALRCEKQKPTTPRYLISMSWVRSTVLSFILVVDNNILP